MLKVIPSSVSHARGVYSLYILFLVAAKLINDTEGERCPVVVDLHAVVLVALHGTGIVFIVEDVVAIKAQSHLPSCDDHCSLASILKIGLMS